MNAWCERPGRMPGVLLFSVALLGVALLSACDRVDTATGTTGERDYTLTLEVVDRFVVVGDQTPLTVRLKRTDNSNLSRGLRGEIVFTVSVNGSVTPTSVPVAVTDDTTQDIYQIVVFTARQGGMAKVRASFRDATATVEIPISSLNP